MKTLLIIRHAKSSWGDLTLDDFDRPLNDRGKRDAPVMARRLLDKKIIIDQFVSSPAKRAKKTAVLFAREYKAGEDKIVLKTELYEASRQTFYAIVSGLDNSVENIALFSHNPGITDFANSLTDTRVDDMPTCAIFAIRMSAGSWADFPSAAKEFWFFDYPKLVE